MINATQEFNRQIVFNTIRKESWRKCWNSTFWNGSDYKKITEDSAVHNFCRGCRWFSLKVFPVLKGYKSFSLIFSRISWVCVDQSFVKILEFKNIFGTKLKRDLYQVFQVPKIFQNNSRNSRNSRTSCNLYNTVESVKIRLKDIRILKEWSKFNYNKSSFSYKKLSDHLSDIHWYSPSSIL